MEKLIKGKVFVLGDNIDTDQIIPAEHLVYSLTDPEESKQYGHFALSGVPLKQAGLPDRWREFRLRIFEGTRSVCTAGSGSKSNYRRIIRPYFL
jgi:3-isopropylmalate/(R)-2-methylmalate dehydratase small subunit